MSHCLRTHYWPNQSYVLLIFIQKWWSVILYAVTWNLKPTKPSTMSLMYYLIYSPSNPFVPLLLANNTSSISATINYIATTSVTTTTLPPLPWPVATTLYSMCIIATTTPAFPSSFAYWHYYLNYSPVSLTTAATTTASPPGRHHHYCQLCHHHHLHYHHLCYASTAYFTDQNLKRFGFRW